MNSKWLWGMVLAAGMATHGDARAQEPAVANASDAARLVVPTLPAWTRVKLETRGGIGVIGNVVASAPDSVVILADGQRTTFHVGHIRVLSQSIGIRTNMLRGLRIGMTAGFMAGAVFGFAKGPMDCEGDGVCEALGTTPIGYALLGALPGAFLGAISGMFVRSEKWRTVLRWHP